MAKTQQDRAVIDLVINGQQAKTSLKEVERAVVLARIEFKKLREEDNPELYRAKLAEYQKLLEAQRQMAGRVNETTTAWGRFKQQFSFANLTAGIVGGNIITSTLEKIASLGPAVVNTYREFNSASQELSAVTGLTGADLEYLNQQAQQVGPGLGKSAAEMLEAYKLMGSAKPELLAQKELLAETTLAAITLSQAGKIDLAEATSVTAESLNQFGESADQANRFINVIAAGAKEGSAEINQMGAALKNSGTVAAAQGLSFEQTNAILQSMSTIALKGGEAGTGLRNVLLTLGSGADETNPKVVGLETALENLGKKNLSTAEMTKLFGKENLVAAQHIIAHRKEIAELTVKVTGTQEAFGQAAKNNATFDHQLQVFMARLTGLAVLIGTKVLPALTGLIDGASSFVKFLSGELTPASVRATQAFEDQRSKVQDLQKGLVPLLARHDELKKKTILTKDEQAELKKIVGQVASVVPSAVTEFDKYGKALGVNTEKAREFIRVQQEMLKYNNRVAIQESEKEKADKEQERKELVAKLNSGMITERDPTSMGGGYRTRKMTKDEYTALQGRVYTLNDDITGIDARLSGLRGDYLNATTPTASANTPPEGKTDSGSGGSLSDEEKKKLEEIKQANKKAQETIRDGQIRAIEDEKQRELEQARWRAEKEKQDITQSKATADLKRKAVASIEQGLRTELDKIRLKYFQKEQEDQAKQSQELLKLAVEDLESEKKIRLWAITQEVEQGRLTKEEAKEQELIEDQIFLEAKQILYEGWYQSYASMFFDNKDLIQEGSKTFNKDMMDLDQALTDNERAQAQARIDIRKAEVEDAEHKLKKKQQKEKEDHDEKKKLITDLYGVMAGNWTETLAANKKFLKESTVLQKAAFIAQRAYALAEIGINLARQISAINAAAAAIMVVPGFGQAAASVFKTLSVAKAIGEAALQTTKILATSPTTPAFAAGGFTDGPAGYVDGPTLFSMGKRRYIAGEAGREFIISNKALQNPVVADLARMMDVAQQTGNFSALNQVVGTGLTGGSLAQNRAESVGFSAEMGLAIVRELQQTREVMRAYAERPIVQNYRLFEQEANRIQQIRTTTKL